MNSSKKGMFYNWKFCQTFSNIHFRHTLLNILLKNIYITFAILFQLAEPLISFNIGECSKNYPVFTFLIKAIQFKYIYSSLKSLSIFSLRASPGNLQNE